MCVCVCVMTQYRNFFMCICFCADLFICLFFELVWEYIMLGVCYMFLFFPLTAGRQKAIHTWANSPALCVQKGLCRRSTEPCKRHQLKAAEMKSIFFFFFFFFNSYRKEIELSEEHSGTQTQNLNSWSVNALFATAGKSRETSVKYLKNGWKGQKVSVCRKEKQRSNRLTEKDVLSQSARTGATDRR